MPSVALPALSFRLHARGGLCYFLPVHTPPPSYRTTKNLLAAIAALDSASHPPAPPATWARRRTVRAAEFGGNHYLVTVSETPLASLLLASTCLLAAFACPSLGRAAWMIEDHKDTVCSMPPPHSASLLPAPSPPCNRRPVPPDRLFKITRIRKYRGGMCLTARRLSIAHIYAATASLLLGSPARYLASISHPSLSRLAAHLPPVPCFLVRPPPSLPTWFFFPWCRRIYCHPSCCSRPAALCFARLFALRCCLHHLRLGPCAAHSFLSMFIR
jgi:hypothetical protein